VILLGFTVLDARPSPLTASPSITFRLRIEELSGAPIHTLALRCQVRIDPRRRGYTVDDQTRLYELFGDASQWDRTLQAVTWAQTTVLVPSFARHIDIDMAVPCTYDLDVAAAKYFHALRDGDVPLMLLFSGTVFKSGESGLPMSIEPVPWDREASYRMPASVWRSAMEQFFPGGGWMRVSRETLDRLQAFRGRHAIISWDEAIERLLHTHTAEQVT